MSLLVQKFGGTSVAGIDRICEVSQIIADTMRKGHKVVVVISAMAGVTNHIMSLCNKALPVHSHTGLAEYDAALSTGEPLSAALLAMALQNIGYKAQSFAAWQLPIRTDSNHLKALVKSVDTQRLIEALDANTIPVVTGFTGVNDNNNPTTLGRGGSDTTAVLIAAALKANACHIYTDVLGVYSADPRVISNAIKFTKIDSEMMLALASEGAKVLSSRCVEIAMRYNVPITVLSTFQSKESGTCIYHQDGNNNMENTQIKSLTINKAICLFDISQEESDQYQISSLLLTNNIEIFKMMIMNKVSRYVIALNDKGMLETILTKKNIKNYNIDLNVSVISILGYGMKNDYHLMTNILSLLQKEKYEILFFDITEIKMSIFIHSLEVSRLLEALHHLII